MIILVHTDATVFEKTILEVFAGIVRCSTMTMMHGSEMMNIAFLERIPFWKKNYDIDHWPKCAKLQPALPRNLLCHRHLVTKNACNLYKHIM